MFVSRLAVTPATAPLETVTLSGNILYVSSLLQSLPIRPMECWGARGLRDRLDTKLGPSLPFAD